MAQIANTFQFAYNFNHNDNNYRFYGFGGDQNPKQVDLTSNKGDKIIEDKIFKFDNGPRGLMLADFDRNVKIMATINSKMKVFYEKYIEQIDKMIGGPQGSTTTPVIAPTNLEDLTKLITDPRKEKSTTLKDIDGGSTTGGMTSGESDGGSGSGSSSGITGGGSSGQSTNQSNPTLGSSGSQNINDASGSAMAERGGFDPNAAPGNSTSSGNGSHLVAVKSTGKASSITQANGSNSMGSFGGIFNNDATAVIPASGLSAGDQDHVMNHLPKEGSSSDSEGFIFDNITNKYFEKYNVFFGKSNPPKVPSSTNYNTR
jgi:hypothetical protein